MLVLWAQLEPIIKITFIYLFIYFCDAGYPKSLLIRTVTKLLVVWS
jgi:hypothetical protein